MVDELELEVVEVTWRVDNPSPGRDKPIIGRSVGYLVRHDGHETVLATQYSLGLRPGYGQITVIPAKAMVERQGLYPKQALKQEE